MKVEVLIYTFFEKNNFFEFFFYFLQFFEKKLHVFLKKLHFTLAASTAKFY